MATGIVALFDDVALLADDTAMAARHAGAATAPILGDDVAVNAGAATGFSAKRELVVIWEIAKGAFWNKVWILPACPDDTKDLADRHKPVSVVESERPGVVDAAGGIQQCLFTGITTNLLRFEPEPGSIISPAVIR